MAATVAIVHDYLTQRGGAERVLLSMTRAFPGAAVHTSVYEPDSTFPEFREVDVRPMWTNRLASLRRDHRRGLLVYPGALSFLRVDADIVLCSSSAFAHGVRTDGHKVVYCYTPPRWLYDQAQPYLQSWPAPVRAGVKLLGPALRRWDQRSARTAHWYLTSSSCVRARILDVYGMDATVVPPGTRIDPSGSTAQVAGCSPGFVMCVSRLIGYKNVDIIVRAFNLLPDVALVVAGEGPDRERLQSIAARNVRFLPTVSDEELRWLYANCSLLVGASFEDFGLTPLEAAAWGKPAAVLRAGGYLDTVRDGITGRFFDDLDSRKIASLVSELLENPLPPRPILEHYQYYTEEAFIARLQSAVHSTSQALTAPLSMR